MEFMKNPTPFVNGEFVLHIDSDDILYDGYLHVCKNMFNLLPDVGMILCSAYVCDQNGRYIRYQEHNLFGAICFTGRCWRKSLDFSFDGILDDDFFTLSNDLFIVGMVSLKSKVLVIPRTFIKYRLFLKEDGEWKPFGERTNISEKNAESHSINHRKFSEHMITKTGESVVAKETHPFFKSIQDLSFCLLPTHNFTNKKFNMIGFDLSEEELSLIKILYSDKEIQFSNRLCVDCLNIISPHWRGVIDNPQSAIFSFSQDTNNLQWLIPQIGIYGYMSYGSMTWIYTIQ